MKKVIFLNLILLISFSCKKKEDPPEPTKDIFYKADGRKVKQSDPYPIALDVNEDGIVDFTIFVELTANASGDHLYVGINPIGIHLIKSGPADDDRYLSMGFVIAENTGAVIQQQIPSSQRWTADHSTLAIRHTNNDATVWYEGEWGNGIPKIAAIQLVKNGKSNFGWLRMSFDKTTEEMTLIDYAYEKTEGQSIKAGDF